MSIATSHFNRFDFSLDPGTGPMAIKGRLDGLRLSLEIASAAGSEPKRAS